MPTVSVVRGGGSGGGVVGGQRYASPHITAPVAGAYYDNAGHGVTASTLTLAANQLVIAPYLAPEAILIDMIGVSIATAAAGVNFHMVVYAAGANGWPSDKLYESGNLSAAVANYVGVNPAPFGGFEAGKAYWLGVLASGGFTIRAVSPSSAWTLGLTTSAGATYNTALRKSVQFGAGMAPQSWAYVDAERLLLAPPSVRFRAVAG